MCRPIRVFTTAGIEPSSPISRIVMHPDCECAPLLASRRSCRASLNSSFTEKPALCEIQSPEYQLCELVRNGRRECSKASGCRRPSLPSARSTAIRSSPVSSVSTNCTIRIRAQRGRCPSGSISLPEDTHCAERPFCSPQRSLFFAEQERKGRFPHASRKMRVPRA